MLTNFFNYFINIAHNFSYGGIVMLMTIESSFLPLPSEVIIPPFAYLAAQGKFNIFLVIIFGILGSILGATVNYILSRTLGRVIIYRLVDTKLAKLLFITRAKLEYSEKVFLENSAWSTFWGRLVPVVRHLISIPAGFCEMPYGRFILFTALGSSVWISVLALMGYFIGANQELILVYANQISWTLVALVIIYLVYRFYFKKRRNRK
jgi:membrane protein DedA with SNARE-associated domain